MLGILLILFGPPGFFWKVPNVKETIQESKMTMLRMRLCHFGDQYDKSSKSKPSGSYLQLATTAKLSHKKWQCNCTIPIQEHVLDWYGRHPEQAEWRRKISVKFVKEVCNTIPGIVEAHGNLHSNTKVHAIQDGMTSPLPTNSDTEQNLSNPEPNLPNPSISLPTDARLRQKERLTKLKEAGLKPKKKKTYTEPGTDDCGDDISGLGKDAILLSLDVIGEVLDSSDSDGDLFITIPLSPPDSTTNIYSAVSQLCYGKHNTVDLLELCGGEGRISQVAFKRGLTSGGNIDLTTGCDLGLANVQRAINHYLNECNVMVVIL